METRLKALLRERHWTYTAFSREYDRAAGLTAPELIGTAPSRAQLHRWISGQLKGLPFPDHCHVLEKMFPGWTARQLFELVDSMDPAEGPMIDRLVHMMSTAFASGVAGPGWGAFAARRRGPGRAGSSALQQDDGTAVVVAKRLMAVAQLRRLDAAETAQLAGLAGDIVELGQAIDIAIEPDGTARVGYRHELFNMTDRPITRFTRELWFQQTSGTLNIAAASEGSRRISVHRIHDTASMAKFACRISPAIQPGEVAGIGYYCTGGVLSRDLFWRQQITHYTRHLTVTVTQRGIGEFVDCSAIEEHPDGAENAAVEHLLTQYEDDVATVTFTRDYLRPGQALTLRWEFG